MNRREAIKGMAALGAASILLNKLSFLNSESKSIHFIGIGGAGSNCVEFLHKKGIKAKYTCISNPVRENLPSAINFIHFIQPGVDYFKNERYYFQKWDVNHKLIIPAEVLKIFESNDQFVLLAGLGGYTGTFMTKQLTLFLQAKKKDFLTICSLPFYFEGINKREKIGAVIKNLRPLSNFKTFELSNITKKYGNMKLSKAFEKANEQFYEVYIANA